eukprot:scaffold52580_cov16-Prasinocladus_malaysianus.AAC.1
MSSETSWREQFATNCEYTYGRGNLGGSNYALYLDGVDVESPEGLSPRQVALPPAPAALATALHEQNRPEARADGQLGRPGAVSAQPERPTRAKPRSDTPLINII